MGRDQHPTGGPSGRLSILPPSEQRIPHTSMETKAFGPSMSSEVPVSVRPETNDTIVMLYGKQGGKWFASVLIVGLLRLWGWPWEIVGTDRDKRGFHEEWRGL